MLKIKNYRKVSTTEEAYELNQKKSNQIIGGMLWLKMQDKTIDTAIDMSGLGLDTIEETKDAFIIGSMVSLRDIEIHEGLNAYTQDALRDSVASIVGVQFRNLATVGGSLFGRYGFSDVLTIFMALGAKVELHNGGIISLEEFASMNSGRDILVRIILEKRVIRAAYLAQRNTKTDFPVLTCAVVSRSDKYHIAIGARPARASVIAVDKNDSAIGEIVASKMNFGSNGLAQADYREHLCIVLVERALTRVEKGE